MAVTYPSNYPCPSQEGYAVSVDVGLRVMKMNAGNTMTRRRTPARRVRIIGLTFDMTQKELFNWSNWMDKNGFNWFDMDLVSDKYNADPITHTVKLIEGWSENYLSPNIWKVGCKVEVLS